MSTAPAPKVRPLSLSPKKAVMTLPKQVVIEKGLRITVKLTIQNRQAQIKVVSSTSALIIKALKELQKDRKKEKKTLNTEEILFLMRLSTLPNRCSTNLYLGNSLEPFKRSRGLPSLWVAILVATTLMRS